MSAPRAAWHTATVAAVHPETPTARRIEFDISTWPGNDAGSHLDIRLTAEDGYQASRSYSIASSGASTRVVLAIAEVPGGEVSPFLVEGLQVGDKVEIHGPLGAFFVWRPPGAADSTADVSSATNASDATDASGGALRPVQLIAGGSGVVPLYAMAMAHAEAGDPTAFRLLYSVRTPVDVFFKEEIAAFPPSAIDVSFAYTRKAPDGDARPPGRLTADQLAAAVWPPEQNPRVFVCGPTPFVESIADTLVAAGHDPRSIRTERFGGA
ncbi:FAD-binding oxidoreductase [Agromyces protaetiae]|uniref:FAD-binding oxidoreductase n=1 Tax=Agromyces protaetiae TaxID=2509455 RepID=UPI001FB74A36|nr:FAD-binding oxidoreductase [Agromyces protaetiae]